MKAMYRRAQAYMETADLDLAELDIKKALEIDPDNKCVKFLLVLYTSLLFRLQCVLTCCLHREVKIEFKKLKEKMKEYNKKDAQFYSKMLAKMLEPHVSSYKWSQ